MNTDWHDRLFQLDCIKGMNTILPERVVDVIVTSPPYNIGINYNLYNDQQPFEKYLQWMGEVAKSCRRVLKEDGSLFLNLGDKPSDDFRSFKIATKFANHFKLQNTIHWVKSIAIPEKGLTVGHYKPVNSDRYLNNSHEYIFHFTKNGDVPLDKLAIGVPYADKSNIGRWKQAKQDLRGRGNQWFIPYQTVQEKKSHPAAFPVKLVEMCIKLHGLQKNNQLIILDPFMGSGSTALAAKKLGCRFVGFEIDPNYIQLAKQRLELVGKEP